MSFLFPQYSSRLECSDSSQSVFCKLSDAVGKKYKGWKLLNSACSESRKMVISTNPEFKFSHNSVMPLVEINASEADGKACLDINFECKKIVKVFQWIFIAFCAIFCVGLLAAGLFVSAVIPALMLGFILLVWPFFLRLFFSASSKKVLKELCDIITDGADFEVPRLILKK